MYQGIQFLNEEQESLITDYWKANIGRSDDLDLMHRDLLRKHCSHIARWLVQAREGDIYTIDKSTGKNESACEIYFSLYVSCQGLRYSLQT